VRGTHPSAPGRRHIASTVTLSARARRDNAFAQAKCRSSDTSTRKRAVSPVENGRRVHSNTLCASGSPEAPPSRIEITPLVAAHARRNKSQTCPCRRRAQSYSVRQELPTSSSLRVFNDTIVHSLRQVKSNACAGLSIRRTPSHELAALLHPPCPLATVCIGCRFGEIVRSRHMSIPIGSLLVYGPT
jgi:hypothetical protein